MGVVIEICIKYPGGPTRMTVTDMVPVFIRSTGILINSTRAGLCLQYFTAPLYYSRPLYGVCCIECKAPRTRTCIAYRYSARAVLHVHLQCTLPFLVRLRPLAVL